MIDSHCHLDFDAFDSDRDEAIDRALQAGVHTIVNIGADIESSRRSVKLSEQHDCIYATVGIHPHDAKTLNHDTLAELERLAAGAKTVAIGEIGLDFYRDLSPRKVQREAFRQQLELAIKLNLPVVIHTREAFDETVAITKEYAARLPGGVFHCFPGDAEQALEVIRLGFVISVGGVITYPKSGMARTAEATPLDKILLETDAPYLTPQLFRGNRNQPAYVSYVCDKLAELKGLDRVEVERVTDGNCRKLFRLGETFEG